MDIDTSVLEGLRAEAKALAAAISKHLDAHPEYPRGLVAETNYLWSNVDYAANAMGCARCEYERIGIVDDGLGGRLCHVCAEKVAA
jgi:hypothetical protein